MIYIFIYLQLITTELRFNDVLQIKLYDLHSIQQFVICTE